MTGQLPAGDTRKKRRGFGTMLLTIVAVLAVGGGLAVASGAVKVPKAHHAKQASLISPACQPHTLWLIWRVEGDADTHGTTTTTERLNQDIRRLETAIADDPYRTQLRNVIRGIKANTIGGTYTGYRQEFARIVNSEPRC